MNAVDPRLEMNQSKNHVLHIDHIGSEKNLQQDPAHRNGQEQEKRKVVPQNGDIENSIQKQAASEQKSNG